MSHHTFYDTDRNNNPRELVVHFIIEPETSGDSITPSTDAMVSILQVDLIYKGMRRKAIDRYISSDEISKAENEILELETN